MIREGKKLPDYVADKLPALIELVSSDHDVIALFVFGSLARGELKPLSDLDFGILLDNQLSKIERFRKHIDLAVKFSKLINTDEIDIIILNDAPMRFIRKVLTTGKLVFERDRKALVDLCDRNSKMFLDFKYFVDDFNRTFLKGIGYHG
jgi:predicted nucleotidyltransferase